MITVGVYKLFAVPEEELIKFLDEKGLTYSLSHNYSDYLLKINTEKLDDLQIDTVQKELLKNFSKYIYAESDISLQEQLVKILSIRNAKISCAESFTGGRISSMITSVSGSSKVFYEGIVAYSPDAKNKRLGVREETLEEFKPVSSQVATEMLSGLLGSETDFAISTTGIAGPNSDDSNFPVGLCYIGIGSKSKISIFKHKLKGDRKDICKSGANLALFHAVMALRSGKYDV
ncbi:MAG: CinA family protein [Clostridiales bacterium]|nr:CinA family protein [Clostridiales bacterium]